jgi:hypothetical protein
MINLAVLIADRDPARAGELRRKATETQNST